MSNGPYYYDIQEGYCGSKEDYYDDKGHLYDDPYNMWIDKLESLKTVSRNEVNEIGGKRKNYFAGKIILNAVAHNKYLWGGIENPSDSNIKLLIDRESITNFTEDTIEIETWINPKLNRVGKIQKDIISTDFTCSNIISKCNLKYDNNLNEKPSEGVNPSIELIGSQSTLTRDHNGRYILPPGSFYVILIKSIALNSNINLSLAWWEEEF